VLALATYLVLGFGVCLTTVPLPDEAYISNPSFNFATKGTLGTTLFSTRDTARAVGCFTLQDCLSHSDITKQHQDSYFGMTQYTYWVFPTYLVLQAGWYRVFGFGLTLADTNKVALPVLWPDPDVGLLFDRAGSLP
jgi:hypothetical protein